MLASGIAQIFGRSRKLSGISTLVPSIYASSRAFTTKLFVGGLSYIATNEGLSEVFSNYGQVMEASVVVDKFTGKSKGFGFVTFASNEEATRAMSEILNGRVIFVSYAKPKGYSDGIPIACGPPETSPADARNLDGDT